MSPDDTLPPGELASTIPSPPPDLCEDTLVFTRMLEWRPPAADPDFAGLASDALGEDPC